MKGPDDYEVELNEKNRLYFRGPNQVRSVTFLRPLAKGKPPRSPSGTCGASAFTSCMAEEGPAGQVMLGHQGPVMAVAPSSGGQLLVSRDDQTVCCWSLVDWRTAPSRGEVPGGQQAGRGRPRPPRQPRLGPAYDRRRPAQALAVTLPSVIPAEGEIF
ncbi:MAG: hypothetical protein U0797_30145 [Gemmataceae bacterium]